jgi:hypothetical protein
VPGALGFLHDGEQEGAFGSRAATSSEKPSGCLATAWDSSLRSDFGEDLREGEEFPDGSVQGVETVLARTAMVRVDICLMHSSSDMPASRQMRDKSFRRAEASCGMSLQYLVWASKTFCRAA